MSHTDATQLSAAHPSATEPLPPLPSADLLPDDLGTLKSMVVELLVTLRQRDRDLAEVRQRVDLLLRRLYGPRAERFNPNQQLLFAELIAGQDTDNPADGSSMPAEQDKPEPPPSKRRRCRPHGRRRLPEHLPRREIVHTPACFCPACGGAMRKVGEDVSEVLDYIPGRFTTNSPKPNACASAATCAATSAPRSANNSIGSQRVTSYGNIGSTNISACHARVRPRQRQLPSRCLRERP